MFYTRDAALDYGYEGLTKGATDFIIKLVRVRNSKAMVWVVRFMYG